MRPTTVKGCCDRRNFTVSFQEEQFYVLGETFIFVWKYVVVMVVVIFRECLVGGHVLRHVGPGLVRSQGSRLDSFLTDVGTVKSQEDDK